MPSTPASSILISVLNWNGSADTVRCVDSLLLQENPAAHRIEIVVIDNGSTLNQWHVLEAALAHKPVRLIRLATNLGFAGGHNVALEIALSQHDDFAWLFNNDAIAKPGALARLADFLQALPTCGAASPVVCSIDDESVVDFCGAMHDWKNLATVQSMSPQQTREMEQRDPQSMWLNGPALFLRVAAIRQIGLLNAGYFAYYEDDEICARLALAGWRCCVAFDAVILHSHIEAPMHDKGAYFFYLMARNSFKFWYTFTPAPFRSRLRVKLIDRALLTANRLHQLGLTEKRDACLLGIYDGQRGVEGRWQLERSVPWFMRLLRAARWRNHLPYLK